MTPFVVVLFTTLYASSLPASVTSSVPSMAPFGPAELKFVVVPNRRDVRLTPDELSAKGARVVAVYPNGYAVTIPEPARDEFIEHMTARGIDARPLDPLVHTPGRKFDPRTAAPPEIPLRPGLVVLQYVAPAIPDWQRAVADSGADVVGSLPEYAVLIVATPEQVRTLASHPWVQYLGPYAAQDKFAPFGAGQNEFVIQIADTGLTAASVAEIERQVGRFITRSSYGNVLTARVKTDLGTAHALLQHPFVLGIETYVPPRLSDERQALSVTGATTIFGRGTDTTGYRAWLAGHGITPSDLTNSGIVVDVADTGIDYGCTMASRAHRDLQGRIVYNTGTGGMWRQHKYGDFLGHGSIVAGIAGGSPILGINTAGAPTNGYDLRDGDDGDGYGKFLFGMGIAPGIRIGNTVMMDPNQTGSVAEWTTLAVSQYCNSPSNLCPSSQIGPLCAATVQNHSNNEYDLTGGEAGYYTASAREFDISVRNANRSTFVPLAITVSAGNIRQDATDPTTTVLPPATAKNVISVGGVETFRDRIPAACLDSTLAGNYNPSVRHLGGGYSVLAYLSRRGTADGRLKPDVLAPATLALGPHPAHLGNAYCMTGGTTGTATSPEYHGSSGTSYAAPVAAGSIALLRYVYSTRHGVTPSPAMYKAMLVAGARSILNGYDRYTSSTITKWPNAQQGFGVVTLENLFTPYLARDWRDQSTPLLQSQTASYSVTVNDPAQPVRIVLAWTDVAALPQAIVPSPPKSLVNDLDLKASWPDGTRYYGNAINSAGYSYVPSCGRPTCGYPGDGSNNVEVLNIDPVRFATSANRTFTISVTAALLNGVAVETAGSSNNQDFALFVINGTLQNQ